jgi:hypothetical protein
MTRVRRKGTRVVLDLSTEERSVLGTLVDQVVALLAVDDAQSVAADPALSRLLPDAYRDDPDAAAEFRGLMQDDLRAEKRAALATIRAATATGEDSINLTPDETEVWLRALTDVRLVLGTRLDVQEDMQAMVDSLVPDDPRLPLLLAYDWLGFLQESLVHAVDND